MFLEAERQFGLNFLKTLPAHNESLVFSPLSIALVLSMVHTGARGRSKEQIGDALLNGASDDQFVNHFSDVNEKIRSGTNGVEVYVANRVYLNKGFTANPSFLAVAFKNYGADAKTLDFESLTAVREINTFVKEATKAKITDIASKDSIKNAVALLKVKFMKESMWDRGYSSDDVFQVLHLGYADQRFQFSVFLPKERNTLTKALEKLDVRRFKTLLSNVRRTFMNTQLPKFTIEREINLKTHLESLGITDIFSDSANLSGLAKNIKISGGVHKAIIEVNEDGTVAAAATMAKAVPMSMRMETPVDFKADHPFMFTLSFMNHPIFLGVFNG
ncbi:unnamed protein product [Caenorhabditis brenneri]